MTDSLIASPREPTLEEMRAAPDYAKRMQSLLIAAAAYRERKARAWEHEAPSQAEYARQDALLLRDAASHLASLVRDAQRLDALIRGDIEIECMGTDVRYFNVTNGRGDLFTTAGDTMTLREAIDAAHSLETAP